MTASPVEHATVVQRQLARPRQTTAGRHDINVSGLEQPRDAVTQLRGDGIFAGHEGGEVEAHLTRRDAVSPPPAVPGRGVGRPRPSPLSERSRG